MTARPARPRTIRLFVLMIAPLVIPLAVGRVRAGEQPATGPESKSAASEHALTAVGSARPRYSIDTKHPGYRFLLETPLVPPDLDDEVFARLWECWEEPARTKAAAATPEERRRMAFERYGFTEAPGRPGPLPLQYTPAPKGGWSMNCFACHGGRIGDEPAPGLPNADFDLSTFIEEVRFTKLKLKKPLAHLDVGAIVVPLSTGRGTTNSVVFGIALGVQRDRDLNPRMVLIPPKLLHHDEDAPAWWSTKHRPRLYIDAFVEREHRALMQFMLTEKNSGAFIKSFEGDFKKVLEWIEGLPEPKYPGPIDAERAERGKVVFARTCASCHGTHRDGRFEYPDRHVPLAELGTDPARHQAIEPWMRKTYREGWFGDYGRIKVEERRTGYTAPPLIGVWATAPYLHNGSVPTLWHVLHPERRPKVWKRVGRGYDQEKVGLAWEEAREIPKNLPAVERRRYYDTGVFGKSAAGHDYPIDLNEADRAAVLEYLKTL
jgi:mono/diheme cytochrome c family protein